MTNIVVGTSSRTDKSLIDSGRFYPARITTPKARLHYYASQFPIVEIDSSYYGIPTAANAAAVGRAHAAGIRVQYQGRSAVHPPPDLDCKPRQGDPRGARLAH